MKPLVKGDTILIISPAKAIEISYINLAISLFNHWGLRVEVGPHATNTYYYFSGNDDQRAADLQWAMDHTKARAIVCARGGYGAIRIVDKVDYTRFLADPKWMIGFSDITVFHQKINEYLHLPSIHSTLPLYFDQLQAQSNALISLKNLLFHTYSKVAITSDPHNKVGEAAGMLVGGNLAVICSLVGTTLDISTAGKILFIEEISEYAYRFDRMLWTLKKSGKLDHLAGLVVGGLIDIKLENETFGCCIESIISDLLTPYAYPIMFNYPAGHILDNRALMLGAPYTLKVTDKKAELTLEIHGNT